MNTFKRVVLIYLLINLLFSLHLRAFNFTEGGYPITSLIVEFPQRIWNLCTYLWNTVYVISSILM